LLGTLGFGLFLRGTTNMPAHQLLETVTPPTDTAATAEPAAIVSAHR
jgi:hypothetical protein